MGDLDAAVFVLDGLPNPTAAPVAGRAGSVSDRSLRTARSVALRS